MASAGGAGSGAAGAASGDVAAAGAAARPLAAAAPASGDHAALSKRVAAFVAAEGGAGGGVSGPFLAAAFDDFDAAPKNALALNSVTQNGPLAGALNRSAGAPAARSPVLRDRAPRRVQMLTTIRCWRLFPLRWCARRQWLRASRSRTTRSRSTGRR